MKTRALPLAFTAPARRPGAISRLRAMHAAWRSRAALARLEPHLLDDIGVTPAEARTEAARPVWDVPAKWLR